MSDAACSSYTAWVLQLQTTQGRPHNFIDMRIVDDNGKELPRDGKAMGHLQVGRRRVLHGFWCFLGVFGASSGVWEVYWVKIGGVLSKFGRCFGCLWEGAWSGGVAFEMIKLPLSGKAWATRREGV